MAAVELQEEEATYGEQLDDIAESSGSAESEEESAESDVEEPVASTSTSALAAGPSTDDREVEDKLAKITELAQAISIASVPVDGDSPFDRTQVLTVEQLEELFLRLSPDLHEFALPDLPPPKFCVGLVGYPNVGKSSTINALVGQKKVSVSSTPGKTKNFQTIHLSPDIVLCDCPGLVFPQFAVTKASMVCDGVLPIDQMREHTGPVDLVTHRIPKAVLEGIYGLRIPILPISEGGSGTPTAQEFLSTYAGAWS